MKTRLDRLRPMVAIGSVALFVYLLRRTGFEGVLQDLERARLGARGNDPSLWHKAHSAVVSLEPLHSHQGTASRSAGAAGAQTDGRSTERLDACRTIAW